MQRKQFGKRGAHQSVPQFGDRQTSYAGAAMPAYAGAGGGAVYTDDGDSFSIGKALSGFLSIFFSFHGRMGRMEYWTIGTARWVMDIILLVTLFMSQFSELQQVMALEGTVPEDEHAQMVFGALFGSTTALICMGLLLISTVSYWSIQVRRSHDRDASGLMLLIMFVPIIGAFYAIWIFIANGFFPGTPGPNRFDTARSQAHVFD
ncbi:DUF805 domain-containing protein [Roseibium sp.]|uniref:DUF805 domain-containing protein n=1 Tax=Roseibium sp. TaxID=1936156 RepID=UPI003BAA20F6